jgi:D-apionolactonase
MLPKNVFYYGIDEELPEQVPLHAGPLELIYEQGSLRYVRYQETEVLRRIYVAIRDRNWGTVEPAYSNVVIRALEDSFTISFQVENHQNEISFQWKGVIQGDPDGTITFSMEGEALTTFLRNRIGFCILHPAELAGRNAVVEHVDGKKEIAVFPSEFEANQPVPPFSELRAISHEMSPGLWADVTFGGDIFETEDQRNWTDASFKTFCTPLRIPYPVEIITGTKISQSVTLRLRKSKTGIQTKPSEVSAAVSALPAITILRNLDALPIPRLGLSMAYHKQALSERESALLRALHLHHLRVDLHLSDSSYKEELERATADAQKIRAGLEIALFTSSELETELAELRRLIDRIRPEVCAWLCYLEKEKPGSGQAIAALVQTARKHLTSYNSAVPFYAGTNADYIALKRSTPPSEEVDGLTFAICPQVHAFDNASLVETLQVQGEAVNNARHLGHGKPVIVSPITLKKRFNPYATSAEPPPSPDELPSQVDIRQMSLFGAAWTLGSIRSLTEVRTASITYYETTGWRGVMETQYGSSLPAKFCSFAGGVFPVYHILAAVGEFSGGEIVPLRISHPLQATALLLQKEGKERLLIASFVPVEQTVRIKNLIGEYQLRRLDEINVHEAMIHPDLFSTQPADLVSAEGGEFCFRLLPYSITVVNQWDNR